MGLIFSTLKQEMRKMFKKNHNLFLQWSSLGILGCNVWWYCGGRTIMNADIVVDVMRGAGWSDGPGPVLRGQGGASGNHAFSVENRL